jgi:hypothetical protein
MVPWLLTCFLAFVPAWSLAGTFDLQASVDRNDVELGDTIQFTLQVTVHGDLAFPPTIPTPTFDGFDAQGPSRSYSSSWINGAVTITNIFTWQLEAQKSGRLVLGPFRATAKDALNGDIARAAPPIVITVHQPKGLNYPSANAPQQQAEPDGTLRDIKPDRGLPWVLVACAFCGLLALLTLLALLAHPKAPPEPVELLPADPALAAIQRLDKALQAFLADSDERAYAVAVGEVLRQYLRQRLELRPGLELRQGLTLGEAVAALRRQVPHLQPQRVVALRRRLELLLYGAAAMRPEDREQLDLEARDLIRGLEAARKLTPAQLELSRALERLSAAWQEGQVKGSWMGMRAAALAHLRRALGKGRRALPWVPLSAALGSLDAPELLRTLDWLRSEVPPRGAGVENLAPRLMRLAQAVDALDKRLIEDTAVDDGGDDELNDEASPDDGGTSDGDGKEKP